MKPTVLQTVSYIATTPKPRLAKLVFSTEGEDTFTAGSVRYKATHYLMKVQIGGIAGIVAPLLGKKPPDTDIWVLGGMAPTFASSRGPLYGGGPRSREALKYIGAWRFFVKEDRFELAGHFLSSINEVQLFSREMRHL